MLDTFNRTVSLYARRSEFILMAHLSNQHRRTHTRPSSAIVSELCEDRGGALLGRRHDPQTDYHRYKSEKMDAAEDSFGQRKMLCTKDVERRNCDHRYPSQEGALPALWSVRGIVDHHQRLYKTADNKRIHGND